MEKNKIVVISDVHIGTNTPTNWYQRDLHEPYLLAVLNWILEHADSVRELVILGDLVDFWTYPPSERPPNFSEIVTTNPNIFGPQGKLNELLSKLDGNISYLPGNHDLGLTQEDLNTLSHPDGYQIRCIAEEIYVPQLPGGQLRVVFAHGHGYTYFNAPDLPGAGLPVGHLVTRAVAYKLAQEPGKRAAELPGNGAPSAHPSLDDVMKWLKDKPSAFTGAFLDYIARTTTMPEDTPILLPGGGTTSFEEAKQRYATLWDKWVQRGGGNRPGSIFAEKAIYADYDGTFMPWFAMRLAMEQAADLVVMGHTHRPARLPYNGVAEYLNSGYLCPAIPDLPHQPPVFATIDVGAKRLSASHLQVVKQGDGYVVTEYTAPSASIVHSLASDFSCYVIIDNSYGQHDLQRQNYAASEGYYVVPPPERIRAGERGFCWLQDYSLLNDWPNGARGTGGSAAYLSETGLRVGLAYTCPLIGGNTCSGGSYFLTKSGAGEWGSRGYIQAGGHPFFVRFVI